MNLGKTVFVLVLLINCAHLAGAEEIAKPTLMKTPEGVSFGLLGAKPATPAPTLFIFAGEIDQTLTDPAFNPVGMLLAKQGYLCVSLDAPCHGKDADEKQASELSGWRQRIEQGNDLVGVFSKRCTQVLDFLIADGYTDAKRVASAGTSRGGFLALHFAAAEPRVRCVAAFSPVTNLMALSEFAGTTNAPAAEALSLSNATGNLIGRPLWVSIGNEDKRVGTDETIVFTRALVRASMSDRGRNAQGEAAPVELHVMPSKGHTVYPTAHADAAVWIAHTLKNN